MNIFCRCRVRECDRRAPTRVRPPRATTPHCLPRTRERDGDQEDGPAVAEHEVRSSPCPRSAPRARTSLPRASLRSRRVDAPNPRTNLSTRPSRSRSPILTPPPSSDHRKLTRKTLTCAEEMTALLTCFKMCDFGNDTRCAGEKRALNDCLTLHASRPKQKQTINFHLQRLARLAKR